jgi:hypothetical protein
MSHILHVGFAEAFAGAIDVERDTVTLLLHRYRVERLPRHVLARFARVAVFDTDDPSDMCGYEKQLDTIVALADDLVAEFGPPQAVVGIFEHTVYPAAVLRDRFGVPGTPAAVALRCRDKVEMKRALRAGGVPAPRFWPVDAATTAAELRTSLAGVAGRLVLKPRAQAGSAGVRVFDSLERVLEHAAATGFPDGHELEEFVDGTVCHLDGVVRDGVVRFLSLCRYVGTCFDFEADGAAVGSVTVDDPETLDRATAFTAAVLDALRLRDSGFHLEAFLTPDGGFTFLEIGCRFGGAGVPAQLKLAAGFDIVRESVLAGTGEPAEWTGPGTMGAAALARRGLRASGILWVPMPSETPARVRRIHGLDTCPDSVVFSEIPAIGAELTRGGFYAAAGKFVLVGPSTLAVQADIETLIATYSVETVAVGAEPLDLAEPAGTAGTAGTAA